MNTVTDILGNPINAGDIIMRPIFGGFAFHKVSHITKNNVICVLRIQRNYSSNPDKPDYWYNNPTTPEQVKHSHLNKGKLYLPTWIQIIKLKNQNQWEHIKK